MAETASAKESSAGGQSAETGAGMMIFFLLFVTNGNEIQRANQWRVAATPAELKRSCLPAYPSIIHVPPQQQRRKSKVLLLLLLT